MKIMLLLAAVGAVGALAIHLSPVAYIRGEIAAWRDLLDGLRAEGLL